MTPFRSACYTHYVSSGQAPVQAGLDETKRRWYDRQYGPFLRNWRVEDRILELGCGSGDFLAYLAERGLERAEGVDLSPEQIEQAGGRRLAVACEDARERLARSAGCYDAIVAFDFLEHFTRDELFELLPLIHDALRPGGRLLVQTPNGAGIFASQIVFGDLTHLTILTEDSFRQLVRLHGFSEPVLAETGPVPQGLKGRARWLLWRTFRGVFAFGKRLESGRWQRIWSANLIGYCRREDPASGPSASQA